MITSHDVVALAAGLAVVGHWSGQSVVYAVAVFCLLASFGFHRLPFGSSFWSQAPRLLGVLALPLLVIAPFAGRGVSLMLLWQAAVTPMLVLAGRWTAWTLIRGLRRARVLRECALILGGGHVADQLAEALGSHPEYGLVPLGYVADEQWSSSVPRLGRLVDFERVLRQTRARTVLVAFSSAPERDLVGRLRSALLEGKEVYVVPRLFDVGPPNWEAGEDVWGLPLYRVRPVGPRMPSWPWKRALDVIGAAGLLLLFLPILAATALAVRLSSPGPVLFRQVRIGQDGREFEMLKFRTLYEHASSHTTWSTAAGDNMTSVGRGLRRLHLDELPQLWNILRGDMSLVGPRPERVHFVRQFEDQVPGYDARHRVPVGLTGWAQIHGLRGDGRIEERARFDNRYIEHWSLWRDFTILLRTVTAVIRGSPDGAAGQAAQHATETVSGRRDDDI